MGTGEKQLDELTPENLFSTEEARISIGEGGIKGIVLFGLSAGREPDRVLVELDKEQLVRCKKALTLGTSANLNIVPTLKELLLAENPILAFEALEKTILSMEYNAFRFLALQLEYF